MIRPLQRSYFWFVFIALVWIPLFTLPVHLIQVPLCLLGLVFPPAWGLATRFNRFMFRVILRLQPWYHGELAIRLPPEVERLERGCLVVSNHRSHLDAFLLFRELTHLRIVAKHMLFFVPFFGHMMLCLRMIPVRSRNAGSYLRAMEKVKRGLERGQRVHVFPEMTRCDPGALQTRKFQRAPFHAAKLAGVPIVPVAFWGTDEIWAKGSQKISLGKKAWARSLPAVNPADFPDSEALARHVQEQIDREVLALRSEAMLERHLAERPAT